MKKWLLPFLVASIAALFLWWNSAQHQTNPPAEVVANARQAPAEAEMVNRQAVSEEKASEPAPMPAAQQTATTPSAPSFKPAPPPSSDVQPLPPELAGIDPGTVLENMRTTVRQYGTMFGGNPVGTNPEITTALQGENPKHINFLKADGNRVNAQGELVDAWGTPYFFHQLSGTEMEIRSAGADRIMYTADDLLMK